MSLLLAPSFAQIPEHYYLHWPFCSKKCYYCDFIALEQHADYQDAYAQALIKEMELFAWEIAPLKKDTDQEPQTLYIGGGTPSICSQEHAEAFFSRFEELFGRALSEITIEANPADISEEKLDLWTTYGVNRISIGVQALNDNVLRSLNRRQRVYDVTQALIKVPKYIKNISIDLILGLPGVTPTEWLATVKQAVQWPLSHISIYFLTIHEKTPLYFKVQKGELSLLEEHSLIDLYDKTIEIITAGGFEQYEISNFARPGCTSLHNTAYWGHKPYRAFGLGASSFTGKSRFTQASNLLEYITYAETAEHSFCKTREELSQQAFLTEKIMLGLRQMGGLDEHAILDMLSDDQQKKWLSVVGYLQEKKLMLQDNNRLRLTRQGLLLEQEITVMLMQSS